MNRRRPSPEGVDDLVGNVWELVEGSWTIYPWSDVDPRSPTRGPLTRGGSWVTPVSNLVPCNERQFAIFDLFQFGVRWV